MENQNMEIKKFNIYSVPSYKKYVLEVIEPFHKQAILYSSNNINKIIKELNNDKQYHQVCRTDDILKFNIDIDGLPKTMYEDLENKILEEFGSLNIDKVGISFTKNDNGKKNIKTNTKDYLYSHITFTGICATSSQQKIFWENFVNKYPEYKDLVDYGHLGSKKKWYRLPNQTKEQKKNTEHIIIEGELKDFILHDVDGDLNIDNKIIPTEPKKKASKKQVKKIIKDGKEILEEVEIEYEPIPINETDLKLVELLDPKKFVEYFDWLNMLVIFKSVGLSFDLFDKLSKRYAKDNYDRTKNLYQWNYAKTKKLNIGLIHHLAKQYNPEKYRELNFGYIQKQDNLKTDIITISQRYLLDKDVKKINDKNDLFQNQIIKFFTENYKSLSLKSPYGTGKTQMIKKIIDTFIPKKILWLSYRKTLTKNIIGGEKFGEEYGFKNYQEGHFDADRLIIQLESTLKLNSIMDFTEDEFTEYPSYDLVIIDEIESILSQFNSPTFNGSSKEVFEFIINVIYNSNKLLVLDGDISNRTYNYIESFGKSINIVNDIKINKRNFIVLEERDAFRDKILNDLHDGLKITISSMASAECENFKIIIEEEFGQDKKVLIYTGSSGDDTKEDFNNVDEIWATCDCLIYSPTCEAGVNFDKKYFDKQYGILSDKSTTSRGLLQMFARIRQIKDDTIYLLNDFQKVRTFEDKKLTEQQKKEKKEKDEMEGKKPVWRGFKDNDVKPEEYFTFEEVKNSILALEGIKTKTEDVLINGKMCKSTKINPYDTNYIYNKMESLNNGNYYFLSTLKNMCLNKGHTFKIEPKDAFRVLMKMMINKNVEDEEGIKETKYNKKEEIISVDDIDKNEYEEILKKQNKDKASQEEKFKVEKYIYKKTLGVDILDKKLLDKFNLNSIKNFISLIDVENIKNNQDNQTLEIKDKAKSIIKVINDLGFNNIFDTKEILKPEFEKKMNEVLKSNTIYTNISNTQVRFNLNKRKVVYSIKGFLGFTNSILEQYSVKISYDRKRVKGEKEKVPYYHLEILDDINELLEYRIRRGFKLIDEKNIRPKSTTESYKHLVDFEKLEELENKREQRLKEKEEWIKQQEENKNKYNFSDLDFGTDP